MLFTIELLARIAAFGLSYFWSPDWMWSLLDTAIVLISLAEIGADIISKAVFHRFSLTFVVFPCRFGHF